MDFADFYSPGRKALLSVLFALVSTFATAEKGQAGDGLNWSNYGNTGNQLHFSPLDQINDDNVAGLGLEWFLDLGPGNSVTEPVAVDGVLYFVTGYSRVHAVDVRTGKRLWQYDPKAYEVAPEKLQLSWGSRGLAWWNGKLYTGTQDGRLIAVDAGSGERIWEVRTLPRDDKNFISGAPRVFDGTVFVGFGGADLGPSRGYVSAYNAESGEMLWRWYTVPGNPAKGFENEAMAKAAKTWSGEWWKYGGGGTVWNAISHDPQTDTVFIGTGNGTPWNHKVRSLGEGDNLFLCSIVALDASTGKYKWHYQVNPGDTWDYNATMDMALADISIDGKVRQVLMTAPKNGFFYVLDRNTGELISAEPFAKTTWASSIDLESGRPIEHPLARYPDGSTFVLWPSALGAHSWHPMSYSPETGFAYIPVIEKAQSWTDAGIKNNQWQENSPEGTSQAAAKVDLYPQADDPLDGTSRLQAWDVSQQKSAWSQATTGLAGGGVLSTRGNLVFQGRLDGEFNAYSAETGEVLWRFNAQTPVMAPPISYSVDGRQYITVLSGMGTSLAVFATPASTYNTDYRSQPRRVLTFALDGNNSLPEHKTVDIRPVTDPGAKPRDEAVSDGVKTYHRFCARCHGLGAIAGGNAPDLRASPFIVSDSAFNDVVKGGSLLSQGMPKFDNLSRLQVENIRQYLRNQAAELNE